MDAAAFRDILPEFIDPIIFPDDAITPWIAVAGRLLPEARWADLLDQGKALFTAHNLVLGMQSARSASTGGAPGLSTGVTSSKSVDKVSVSYDTGAALLEGAGHWNLTTYGTRFLWLARMVGAGGVQL